jgi:hypothetical protein
MTSPVEGISQAGLAGLKEQENMSGVKEIPAPKRVEDVSIYRNIMNNLY